MNQNPDGDTSLAMRAEQEHFSGPLPHPHTLKQYKEVSPDFAERIMAMAEREAAHRHQCEIADIEANKSASKADFDEARRGQYCAVGVAVVAIGGAVYCAIISQVAIGCVLGGSTVATAIGAFILGRTAKQSQAQTPPPIKVVMQPGTPAVIDKQKKK